MDTQEVIPAGLAILLIAGAFLVARLWPPASGAMAALRSAVWRHMRRPRLTVVPQPDPEERPPSPVVDGDGRPVQLGDPDTEGSEGG